MTPFLTEARARLDKARPALLRLQVEGLPAGYLAGYLRRNRAQVEQLLALYLLEQEALRRGLHSNTGSEKRWAALRASGATDEVLHEALGRDLGISGGGTIGDPTDSDWVDYRGGKNPEIVLNGRGWPEQAERHKKVWRGKALLAAARRHLKIGPPKAAPARQGKPSSDAAKNAAMERAFAAAADDLVADLKRKGA